ncbi:DUF3078 domain-containing protein [Empedobacter falsenii]|uniref:DUF3078 domain-containing protein n=1 Tax=Empedobacter falsenii TaxID=343874 RepID=UPI00257864DE|nr:DUF3078 domain-containing protein [Empedobacter falsenii]MDM1546630.1 DUF3078 domain-containing protein [Empedobacter falsenii]
MKKILFALAIVGSATSFAQSVKDGKVSTDSKRYLKDQKFDGRQLGWFISGNNSLLFSQNAYSNWIAGGINSFALNGSLDYEFNFTRDKHIWDNRVVMAYGIQANKDDTRKTNDMLEFYSSYGYKIKNNWFLASAMIFRTQFSAGYNYVPDPRVKISNILAPGYLSLGLGVDYKPNENFQINIHPFTPRMTFVMDKDLQKKGNFGLKNDGDNTLLEFGAYLGARYKIQIMDGITYDNRLGIYADYLNKFGNMDLAYDGILDLKVNKFISAQVTINLLYDEDQIKKTQAKQTLGIGFNYKFDNTPPKVEEAPATAFMQEAPIFEEKEETIEVATYILKREPILNETKLVSQ